MTRIARGLAAATGSAALVLTLAGCVPEQAPAPSPVASASVVETIPTPAPAVPAVPVSRVPFACGDLLDQATVDAVLGLEAPLAAPPVLSTLSNYALDQMGALTCTWLDPSDNPSASDGLRLVVIPDAPRAAWEESALLVEYDADTTRFGGESYLHCADYGCDLDMLVNGYWVSLQVTAPEGDSIDQVAVVDLLFAPVVDSFVSASAPPALWGPPGLSAYPAQPSCDELIDPATVSALTGIAVEGAEFIGPTSQLFARSAPGPTVGQRDCAWIGAAASLLPGGAWAFDRAVADLGGDVPIDSEGLRFSRFTTGFGAPGLLATDGADLVLVDTSGSGDAGDFLLEFARNLLD